MLALSGQGDQYKLGNREFIIAHLFRGEGYRPQIKIKVDYIDYGKVSYSKFLDIKDANCPEYVISKYLKLLLDRRSTLDDLQSLSCDVKDMTEARRFFDGARQFCSRLKDVQLLRRFEIGNSSIISVGYIFKDSATEAEMRRTGIHGWTHVLLKKDGKCFVTRALAAETLPGALVMLNEYDHEALVGLSSQAAPKDDYRFELRVPSSQVEDETQVHPLVVKFSGHLYNVAIKDLAISKDPVLEFIRKVSSASERGNPKELLGLWLDEEVEGFNRSGQTGEIPEVPRLPGQNAYLLFSIDFGCTASIFIEDRMSKPSRFQLLTLWKDKRGDFKLTRGIQLKSGGTTFDSSLDRLFRSSYFEDFLRSLQKKSQER